MTVYTFPDVKPDNSSTMKRVPKILRADFGDGYLQAAGDGINPYKETWDLSFSNRSLTDVNSIKNMLDNANGVSSFYWTPPGETPLTPYPKKWFCPEGYTFANAGADRYTISFSIERVQTL